MAVIVASSDVRPTQCHLAKVFVVASTEHGASRINAFRDLADEQLGRMVRCAIAYGSGCPSRISFARVLAASMGT